MGSLGASPLTLAGTPTATSATSAVNQTAQVNVGPFTTPAGQSVGASPLTASPEADEFSAVQPSAAPTAAPSAAPTAVAQVSPVVAPATTTAARAAKRKNLMANIEERSQQEGYVPTAKNLKDLRDKVAFFNKKDAAGLLKVGSELARKHEKAKQLLSRVEQIEGAPPATTRRRTAKPMTALGLNGAGGSTAVGLNGAGGSTAAHGLNGAGGSTAALGLNGAGGSTAANAVDASGFRVVSPMALKRRITARRKNALERLRARVPTPWPSPRLGQTPLTPSPFNLGAAVVAPEGPEGPQLRTLRALVNTPLLSEGKQARGPKTRRSKYSISFNDPGFQKYLIEVIPRFLPLPEMYNPFTGVKYEPDESPLEDIERAYTKLRGIRNEARRLALKMQKESANRAGAANRAATANRAGAANRTRRSGRSRTSESASNS